MTSKPTVVNLKERCGLRLLNGDRSANDGVVNSTAGEKWRYELYKEYEVRPM